jgi:hypothetical protein
MTGTDIAGLVLLLAVFVFVPMILMMCFSSRAHGSTPGLRECPHCGAENRAPQVHCYCCGRELILTESNAAGGTVIQRVRETDGNVTRQPTPAPSPPASKAA